MRSCVDRLLALPQWGEHRARYWLDAARYADTHGIHFDNYREIWSYRDWVIDAFNRNLPFDQFTIEQLAGDLLPNRTLDQQVASGFNRCNITTSEGGAIDEEYLVLYTRDRTETTSQVWLGLTAGCAVCHDHKFDPLTQKEFYSLSAFFNNTTQAAMDGNIKDTPPIVSVPRRRIEPQLARRLPSEIGRGHAGKPKPASKSARADFDTWLQQASPDELAGRDRQRRSALPRPAERGNRQDAGLCRGRPDAADRAGNVAWEAGPRGRPGLQDRVRTPSLEIAGCRRFRAAISRSRCAAWVKLTQANQTGADRRPHGRRTSDYRGWDLSGSQGNRLGMHMIHQWPEDAIKVSPRTELKLDEWHHVLVTYDGSGKAAGVQDLSSTASRRDDRAAGQCLKAPSAPKRRCGIGQRQWRLALE